MKVAVVGSSFASVPAIKNLIKKGIKPLVIDVGNEIEEKNKILMKQKSLVELYNNDKYLCLGGLSNFWTGVVDRYNDSDLNDWPINQSHLDKYYYKLINEYDFMELHKFYSESPQEILNYKIKRIKEFNNDKVFDNGVFSIKFSTILANNYQNLQNKNDYFNSLEPLNFTKYIQSLIKSSKIDYKKEKIIKVKEEENKVVFQTINSNYEKKIYNYDYLFLGGGAISTFKLMKNSIDNFDKNLTIKLQKKIFFPVKFKDVKDFESKLLNIYPIFQINFNDTKYGSIYSQVSNLNTVVLNHFFKNISFFKNKIFLLKYFKNFGYSHFNFGSDFANEFNFNEDGSIKVYENKFNLKPALSRIEDIFNKNFLNKQMRHLKISYKSGKLIGSHFGASFPMRDTKKNFFESDLLGHICNFKKISILDSSIFPKLPAKPPTLTIMANSSRIVEGVLERNFFN